MCVCVHACAQARTCIYIYIYIYMCVCVCVHKRCESTCPIVPKPWRRARTKAATTPAPMDKSMADPKSGANGANQLA